MTTRRHHLPAAALLAAALLLTLLPAAPAAAAPAAEGSGWAGLDDLLARWALALDRVFGTTGSYRDPNGTPGSETGITRDPDGGPLPGVGGWADPDGLTAFPAANDAGSDQDPHGG